MAETKVKMKTPASKLVVKDRSGVLPIHRIRAYFEEAVRQTGNLHSQPMEVAEGEQFAYANAETNIFWLGFAIGMRCSERVLRAQMAAQIRHDANQVEDVDSPSGEEQG